MSGASMRSDGRLPSPWPKVLRKPTHGFGTMPRRFEPCATYRNRAHDAHAEHNTGVAERRLRHAALASVAGALSKAASAHDGGADHVSRDRYQVCRLP